MATTLDIIQGFSLAVNISMQPIPMWSTPFATAIWNHHDQYRDQLIAVCHKLKADEAHSGVAPNAKHGLYESTFNFVEYPEQSVRAWADWAKDSMFAAIKHANAQYWPRGAQVSLEIHESWCHITESGGYHDMHIHPGSSWSAIYYLDTGDTDAEAKNGSNRFYSPINSMWSDAGTFYISSNNSIDINARAGMMVIFPSWIQHSALPYRGDRERIVLALNCRVNFV